MRRLLDRFLPASTRALIAAGLALAFLVNVVGIGRHATAQGMDPSFIYAWLEGWHGAGGSPGGLIPSTRINASSGNVAAATATATMPAVVGKTNYITGFDVTAGGATVAACVNFTITGLVGGTDTRTFCTPAGVAAGATPLAVNFSEPIPASAANVAIAGVLPSLGAGNTNAAVNIRGFVQ